MGNKATLYLVRHGSTALNSDDKKQDRVKGMSDIPLDEKGIAAAHQAGEFLKKQKITHVIASPLQRSAETARIISEHTGAQVALTPRLNPWGVGMYEKKPYYNVSHLLKWHQANPQHTTPGGESYGAFHDRWAKALPELLDFAKDNRVAVVVHSRHLLSLDAVMNGEHPSKVNKVYGAAPPGSIHKLEVEASATDPVSK